MKVDPRNSSYRALSEAVSRWFEYYETEYDEAASETLCNAAVDLFNEGYRSTDDIASLLIGAYVGIWFTRINAPTSSAIH
ncbi:hypothetical protein JNB88_18480 [Rhizobium cauense]|uniref:hypothetical protein n=1 Tax=Rhizobium cauense TaxID=1166683 RepID=UPI001C6F0AEE|nr:hypothetical protein [Rhizobium cauense]MBW9115625.1 hypothetical protein [Rhizobium cauense]